VALDLVGHWLMFQSRFVQEPFDLEVVEVGDAQSFHQPLVHQFLHALPGSKNIEDIAFIVFEE